MDIIEKDRCTGCGLCKNVCPQKCITMKENEEGFLYPNVDEEKCINCNACKKNCPVLNFPKLDNEYVEKHVYCAIHKDSDVWKKSSSGGAFTAICQAFGNENTIIFGAEFYKKKIRHSYYEGINNIDKLHQSKYVQSNIEDTFIQIKEMVKSGKKIIYSGCPCQVGAMRNYLRNYDTSNILFIDLICHGVGSPGLFEKYLDYLEEKKQAKICDFTFRNKKMTNGIHKTYITKIKYDNNSINTDENNLYSNLFFQKIICRKSCDNCIFAQKNRMGDITIADFKKLYEVFPDFKFNKNASTVILNTKKADLLIDKLNEFMYMYPCDINCIEKNNPLFVKKTNNTNIEKRKKFWKEIRNSDDIYNTMKKYKNRTTIVKKVKSNIPDRIKAKIKILKHNRRK
jgi:hypothetical protein